MNKWALITGASGGIGTEMAKILAKDGYDLLLVDISETRLQDLQQLVADTSPNTITNLIIVDLCQEEAAIDIYRHVQNEKINLHVLINNAGFGTLGLFPEVQWERDKRMIRLHVETLTHLTKLFLKDMLNQSEGKILNVASVAGFQPSPLMAVYNATKSYIISFTEAIANEVQGTGVTITVLCPGLTKTGFQKSVGVGNPDFTRKKWLSDEAHSVAKLGINGMQAGKVMVIPGILNNILANLHRFLPRRIVTRLARKIQEKNRSFLVDSSSKGTSK
ncbi:MAG: SDR family oxidoreductase [Saprospiraceae bacterium]|nr:SDR family oxidoreductase [Saprospiraceae bacterium]